MYHDFKISGCLNAMVSLLLVVSSIKAQNGVPFVLSKYLGKKTIKNVTIEETWNGSQWMNFTKKIVSYDLRSNCFDEVVQRWSNSKWINDTRTLTYYDRLQLENAKVIYKWKKNGWEIIEGERVYVDTVLNNGCRLVLHNCVWEPQKRVWIAEDSVLYDVQGRLLRQVSNDYDNFGDLKSDVHVVTTSDYVYQSEDVWIEIQTTNRSDKKRAEKEQFRYRKISDSPLQIFMIDCWDDRINRWVQNTAKLCKKTVNKFSVYDSIEESINGKPVPVYVDAEDRDSSGNLMSQRVIIRTYDENRKKWSGTYYKWERIRGKSDNDYSAAESSFTLNPSGGSWILTSYEKKLCRLPMTGGYEENGNYDENFKNWEYFQAFDTVHPSGIILNKENYFDSKRKQWFPLTDFSCSLAGDSITILKTCFDIDKNNWYNDSLFTIQLDASGSAVSRTNHVWTQSGLFSENWDRVSRISYTRE